MRIHSSRKKIPELVSSVLTKTGLIEVTDTARRNRTESSNPSAPTIINLLKRSLLGRIRFEISKFHVSIQFHGVYGIYTVEPILYKNGTSGTTPNSFRNGPFLR
jgi:hypothetical protein